MKTVHKIAVARAVYRIVHGARAAVGLSDQCIVVRDGVKYDLDLSQGIDFAIFLGNMFEPGTRNALQKLVKPSAVVLDIGANIGAHSLLLAQLVGPSGRVLCFEPTDFAFAKLSRNIELNPELADRITPFHCFLAAKDEAKVPDAIFSSWPLSQQDGLHAKHLGQAMPTNVTQARSVDGILAKLGNPSIQLIKMDVDGFETEVLRGCTALLRNSRPTFLMELSPYVLDERGTSLEELLSHFAPHRYRFYHERSERLLPSSPEDLRQLVGDGASINVIARADK
ncbi:MAG: FkbM family methyltransferase [Candidatus Afipia apatlaquensis]|uniref:FkbM family methyltransferase n=1 Tax=Candidatus Afipia apatlaquensis TaxID=2712852 RepID=A0A7C9VS55_9BRAD|nr:FkbM family methyltransferase [Candidatus Afipia apatlaquensis]